MLRCGWPLHRADFDAFCGGASAVIDIHPAVSDWTIRPAGKHDIEQVLSLWNAAGSAETVTDTREGVLGLLDADPEALFVAESRGTARFAAIVTDDDPDAMGFWTATGYERQESRARFVRNVAPGNLGP
jgi:ribosomal protein S18 acetylase RimI-like enzyme